MDLTGPPDLTDLTRGDLAALQRRLRVVITAADTLAEGGLEPSITLTALETVLRGGPILPRAELAEDVPLIEVEDVPPTREPQQVNITISLDAGAPPLARRESASPLPDEGGQVLPPPVQAGEAAAVPGGGGHGATPGDARQAPAPRPMGPLTESDKALIVRRRAVGYSPTQIADELGRSPSVIAGYCSVLARRAKQAAPAPAAATLEMPGGDGGGLQQHRPAEDDPLQAGAETGTTPEPAPVEAPAEPPARTIPVPVPDPVQGGVGAGTPAATPQGATGRRPARPVLVCPAGYAPTARLLWDHVDRIAGRDGFDDEMDLDLVEGLGQHKAPQVADDLGLDTAQVAKRFKLLTAPLRDARDNLSPADQKALLTILRERVRQMRAVPQPAGAA